MLLSVNDVNAAFKGTGAEERTVKEGICVQTPAGECCDIFVDLFYAYLNAQTIGRNLLGENQYNWLIAELKSGEHAIAVMANGFYSFKGSSYVRGGIFDRIQVAQEEQTINFRELDYYRLNDLEVAGGANIQENGYFYYSR